MLLVGDEIMISIGNNFFIFMFGNRTIEYFVYAVSTDQMIIFRLNYQQGFFNLLKIFEFLAKRTKSRASMALDNGYV